MHAETEVQRHTIVPSLFSPQDTYQLRTDHLVVFCILHYSTIDFVSVLFWAAAITCMLLALKVSCCHLPDSSGEHNAMSWKHEYLSSGSLNVSRVRDMQKKMPGSRASAFSDVKSTAGPQQKSLYSQSRFEGQCRRYIILCTRNDGNGAPRSLTTNSSYLLLANVVHITV